MSGFPGSPPHPAADRPCATPGHLAATRAIELVNDVVQPTGRDRIAVGLKGCLAAQHPGHLDAPGGHRGGRLDEGGSCDTRVSSASCMRRSRLRCERDKPFVMGVARSIPWSMNLSDMSDDSFRWL